MSDGYAEQLSLAFEGPILTDEGLAAESGPDSEQQAINAAGIQACRETLARLASHIHPDTPEGWGPNSYRSMGPGWVENADGDVEPPENGERYDSDPDKYLHHLLEEARRGINRSGIADCIATLLDRRLSEPDWEEIAEVVEDQHRRDNSAA